jgi:hypothetical protein
MDLTNPYSPPRSPLFPQDNTRSARGKGRIGAPLVGAILGSAVLIPAYLALFVMGRDPNGDSPWGWCVGSVLSGIIP